MATYLVRYGDTTIRIQAGKSAEAYSIAQGEYENEFGEGTFDQYDVKVEEEDPYANDY